jgi:hypothetical protein
MSFCTYIARWTVKAAAVAAFAWTGASVSAADVAAPTPPPGVIGAAPVSVGDPGCATCQGGTVKGSCSTCGKSLLSKHKPPYQVNLCPGACFGYFQTQWRKWDEVCPYPYLGVGVSDAPKPPGATPRPGSELNPPRPLDPKMMPDPKKVGSSTLPPIPVVTNKFGP